MDQNLIRCVCLSVCMYVCVSVLLAGKYIYKIDKLLTHLQNMQGQEILKMLEGGQRLGAPKNCPPDLYDVMLSCWNYRCVCVCV